MLYPVSKCAGIKFRILKVITTNFIGRCKFNYLMIMTMTDRVKEKVKKISNQTNYNEHKTNMKFYQYHDIV